MIYEPTFDTKSKSGIQSVNKIENNGVFQGFKVISRVNNKLITQYIINQANDSDFINNELGLNFKGSFAVITYNEKKKIQSIYIGEGKYFKNKNLEVNSTNNLPVSAYIDLSNKKAEVNSSENAKVLFLKN